MVSKNFLKKFDFHKRSTETIVIFSYNYVQQIFYTIIKRECVKVLSCLKMVAMRCIYLHFKQLYIQKEKSQPVNFCKIIHFSSFAQNFSIPTFKSLIDSKKQALSLCINKSFARYFCARHKNKTSFLFI